MKGGQNINKKMVSKQTLVSQRFACNSGITSFKICSKRRLYPCGRGVPRFSSLLPQGPPQASAKRDLWNLTQFVPWVLQNASRL